MLTLSEDLSAIRQDLEVLLRRYELDLSPDAPNTLAAPELTAMLETLETAKARLESISRIVINQLETRRSRPSVSQGNGPTTLETVEDAANRLGLTKQNIYDKARNNQIPGARKIGHYWRIPRGWCGESVC